MTHARDCACQLDHAMPNLARFVRDRAQTTDHWYRVKSVGRYDILQGAGTNGGEWVAKGPGDQVKFNTQKEAEEHAEMSQPDRDHALDHVAPQIAVVLRARTGDVESYTITWTSIENGKHLTKSKNFSNEGEAGKFFRQLKNDTNAVGIDIKRNSRDHALDCMPNLARFRDAKFASIPSSGITGAQLRAAKNELSKLEAKLKMAQSSEKISIQEEIDHLRGMIRGNQDSALDHVAPQIAAVLRAGTGDAPDYTKMSNGELVELRARALTRGSQDPVAEAIRAELDRRARTTTATFKRRTGRGDAALDCMPNLARFRDARRTKDADEKYYTFTIHKDGRVSFRGSNGATGSEPSSSDPEGVVKRLASRLGLSESGYEVISG